jgi:CHASE3 domain sensor protein
MLAGTNLALDLGMMNSLNPQDLTLVFMALVSCLLIASIALFWSIEDQRQTAKRRIKR